MLCLYRLIIDLLKLSLKIRSFLYFALCFPVTFPVPTPPPLFASIGWSGYTPQFFYFYFFILLSSFIFAFLLSFVHPSFPIFSTFSYTIRAYYSFSRFLMFDCLIPFGQSLSRLVSIIPFSRICPSCQISTFISPGLSAIQDSRTCFTSVTSPSSPDAGTHPPA